MVTDTLGSMSLLDRANPYKLRQLRAVEESEAPAHVLAQIFGAPPVSKQVLALDAQLGAYASFAGSMRYLRKRGWEVQQAPQFTYNGFTYGFDLILLSPTGICYCLDIWDGANARVSVGLGITFNRGLARGTNDLGMRAEAFRLELRRQGQQPVDVVPLLAVVGAKRVRQERGAPIQVLTEWNFWSVLRRTERRLGGKDKSAVITMTSWLILLPTTDVMEVLQEDLRWLRGLRRGILRQQLIRLLWQCALLVIGFAIFILLLNIAAHYAPQPRLNIVH